MSDTDQTLPPGAKMVHLQWEDPLSGHSREISSDLPMTFGRQPGCTLELHSGMVSRQHARIERQDGKIIITDLGSQHGTFVNGQRIVSVELENGSTFKIGPYAFSFHLFNPAQGIQQAPAAETATPAPAESVPGATMRVTRAELQATMQRAAIEAPLPSPAAQTDGPFPPEAFTQKVVPLSAVYATGLPVEECTYLALGGGVGSFIWIDHLRIYGASIDEIASIGFDLNPYGRFQRLAHNSQIPDDERMRSDSSCTPDNIWGWPGYGLREAWGDLTHARLGHAFKLFWTLFAEPTLAPTYTPVPRNAYASLDREAERIGWGRVGRFGRVRALRMTDDGRYVVAYSQTEPGSSQHVHKFMIARFVHIALGYPGIKLLPDLMDYRHRTQDFKTVVNAYEYHEHVYQALLQNGGTVVLRGRGIVASRILQRIYEVRAKNPNIQVIHLNRTPVLEGHKFGRARRKVHQHWEIQPSAFPKSTIGGRMRDMLENADDAARTALLNDWGGTTTGDRLDWQEMVDEGLSTGWLKLMFGSVKRVDKREERIVTSVHQPDGQPDVEVEADYVIDATGLNASLDSNPFLKDLLQMYVPEGGVKDHVKINRYFEIESLHSRAGAVCVAGVMANGGPFAGMDSFAGMAFAARRSLELLHKLGAPGVHPLTTGRSISQFIKWAQGVQP